MTRRTRAAIITGAIVGFWLISCLQGCGGIKRTAIDIVGGADPVALAKTTEEATTAKIALGKAQGQIETFAKTQGALGWVAGIAGIAAIGSFFVCGLRCSIPLALMGIGFAVAPLWADMLGEAIRPLIRPAAAVGAVGLAVFVGHRWWVKHTDGRDYLARRRLLQIDRESIVEGLDAAKLEDKHAWLTELKSVDARILELDSLYGRGPKPA